MATNYIQEGRVIDVKSAGPVVSGVIYPLNSMAGVAINDGAADDVVPFGVEGVWIVPLKAGGGDLKVGDHVHLDTATNSVMGGAVSAVAGDVNNIGIVAASGSVAADTHVEIKLTPSSAVEVV